MSGLQDCSKYDIMISARVDGTLNKKDARELDQHLDTCADCRKYLQLLETIRDGLREDLPDPPETLREGIMYKIGLEKHRKLHFGAMGRWTAIAAVLCVVIFGVVKLTGSGVMKASAPEAAAPAALSNAAGGAAMADTAEAPMEVLTSLKSPAAAPAEAPAPAPEPAADSGCFHEAEEKAANESAADKNDSLSAPGSVYRAASLPGYDAARAALDGGEYWGVCVFYDALPEGLLTAQWQTKIPEDGELERWQLSAEELQTLQDETEWDEFYFGEPEAAYGLVLVVAGEEE